MRRLAFAILLPLATAVVAQPAPPPGERTMPDPAQIRQQFEDDMSLLIGLRPDQRPGLQSFLATMTPRHRGWHDGERGGDQGNGKGRDHDGGPEKADFPSPNDTMLTRLDRMSREMDTHDAEAKQRIAAARQFYTSLNPDQQRRLDALDRLKHADMGMRMMMHHRMDHGRG
jgi:hypothetical protein